MDSLVFDRMKRDVELAIEKTGYNEFQKGAYNHTDLNRVESWCEFIQNLLNDYAKNINLDIKTDWNLRDYPFREQIDRIRKNIEILRDACYAIISNEAIEYNNTLNYEQANILEKILYNIDVYIKDMTRRIEHSYNFGIALIEAKYIDLIVDTE